MNSGAYGSYPKRRRYNAGAYVKRKYVGSGRRRTMRVNPVNQLTYRKTRIGKYTKTDMQQLKCTYTDVIVIQPSGQSYTFNSNGQAYRNLAAMLGASPEFVSRVTQYSYYMLNGMSVTFTRQWIDPIAYGVNGVSSGFVTAGFNLGLEKCAINFYPNLITSTVGQPVEDADSSWSVSPFIHGGQSHYQPFPKNFTTGSNSNGLGVWNACSAYTNISGELALYNSGNGAVASSFGEMCIWDLEVNFYVQFCNNTGA
nr:MAG: capsid protein [Cressdnaviricota sp.]